ncbi:MAG: acyl-CoA thioesterase [Gammaproteobacteria bacterium]
MKHFKHKTPIQLRFKDVDLMGHVNNANYLTYIELARLKYFKDVLGMELDRNQQSGIILARMEIDYKLPIFLRDEICVYTRCSHLGTKSLHLSWQIVREIPAPEEIMAQGLTVLVCYDYTNQQTIEISAAHREKIRRYESF